MRPNRAIAGLKKFAEGLMVILPAIVAEHGQNEPKRFSHQERLVTSGNPGTDRLAAIRYPIEGPPGGLVFEKSLVCKAGSDRANLDYAQRLQMIPEYRVVIDDPRGSVNRSVAFHVVQESVKQFVNPSRLDTRILNRP